MKFSLFYKKYERTLLLFLVIIAWALCYFLINSFSEGRTTHILAFSFEKSIPFIPFFVVFYVSAYIIIAVPYFVLRDIQEYRKAVLAYLFVIFISSVIYIIYPVKAMRPEISGEGLFLNMVGWLYGIAKPYNLFPSLHISLSAMSTLICLRHNKKIGYILIMLLFLISFSTLFVKQHYLVDIPSAVGLTLFSYYLFFVRKIAI